MRRKSAIDHVPTYICAITVALTLLSSGCSERRKEAARLEAELEAHRRGTTSVTDQATEEADTSEQEIGIEPLPDSPQSDSNSGLSVDSSALKLEDSSATADTAEVTFPVSLDSNSTVEQRPADSTSMPSRPHDGFTVQIAGTRSADEANGIVERFKLYGYDAYVAEVSRDGRPFYRVRIGRLETESEAIALKNQLMEQQQIEGWVDQGTW